MHLALNLERNHRGEEGNKVVGSVSRVNRLTDESGRGQNKPQVRKQYFSGNQLCSRPPPAGGCAELETMRKIAPPRIKYHWNTAQHGVNTGHRTQPDTQDEHGDHQGVRGAGDGTQLPCGRDVELTQTAPRAPEMTHVHNAKV